MILLEMCYIIKYRHVKKELLFSFVKITISLGKEYIYIYIHIRMSLPLHLPLRETYSHRKFGGFLR